MRRSSAVLAIIVVVLAFSATFIVFANKIAELGIERIDPFVDLLEESEDLDTRIVDVQNRLSRFPQERAQNLRMRMELIKEFKQLEQAPGVSSGTNSDISFRLNLLQENLNKMEEEVKGMDKGEVLLRLELEYLSKRRDDIAEERDRTRELVLSRDSHPGPDGNGGSEVGLSASDLLIATGVTRFGVLIIAVYLVQILINLYRLTPELQRTIVRMPTDYCCPIRTQGAWRPCTRRSSRTSTMEGCPGPWRKMLRRALRARCNGTGPAMVVQDTGTNHNRSRIIMMGSIVELGPQPRVS